MKFCPNCGNNLNENIKFCPNCGIKILSAENKIDKSFEFLKSNAKSIKSEIDNSYIINDIRLNAKKVITEEMPSVFKKISRFIIDLFGIIGLIVIIIQILGYFITNKVFFFDEAYIKWKNYYNTDISSFFSVFIAEILPTTILPFLFMFLSGYRKKWLLKVSILLVIIIFTIRILDLDRVIKYERIERNTKDSIQNSYKRENRY